MPPKERFQFDLYGRKIGFSYVEAHEDRCQRVRGFRQTHDIGRLDRPLKRNRRAVDRFGQTVRKGDQSARYADRRDAGKRRGI